MSQADASTRRVGECREDKSPVGANPPALGDKRAGQSMPHNLLRDI